MTQYATPQLRCPHCGVNNAGSPSFCSRCGKALPSLVPSRPRVVSGLTGMSGSELPTSSAGREMLSGHLNKLTKQASWALLAVAIVETIFEPASVLAKQAEIQRETGRYFHVNPAVWLIVVLIAGAFWGLWAWSRKSPLPAAIVGLALYGTLIVITAVLNPATIGQGWIIKGIVIGALVQGIVAGVKARKLSEPQPPGF